MSDDGPGFGTVNRVFRTTYLPKIIETSGGKDGASFYKCLRCGSHIETEGSPPLVCFSDQGGCGRLRDDTRFEFASKWAPPDRMDAAIRKVAETEGLDPKYLRDLAYRSFALSGEASADASEIDEEATHDGLIAAYRKHFRTEDTAPLDVCLAVIATARQDGDALWVYVVGPPSSGKTELLRVFDASEVPTYFLSSLTPNCLVSGLRDGHDLLPHLDRKTLVVKDLTMTLEMHRENRDALFGALRDAYDGSFSKQFGTVGRKRYDSRFNFIAAVTSAIEDYYTIQAVLGQRFLIVRTSFPAAFETDAERNVESMRHELRALAAGVIKTLPDALPECDALVVDEIVRLAKNIALLRTHVHRDGGHEISSFPEPEAPIRLTNQLLKLARGLALVRGKETVTEEEMDTVRRVARDTIPSFRLRLLETIRGTRRTIDEISDLTGMTRRTVERKIEDMVMLGVVNEDSSGKPYWYELVHDFLVFGKVELSASQADISTERSGGT